MKLDNRPKTLLIRGVPSENVQAVRDWFEVSMMNIVNVNDPNFPSFTDNRADGSSGKLSEW